MTKFDSAAFVICCCVTVTLKKGVARLIKALAIFELHVCLYVCSPPYIISCWRLMKYNPPGTGTHTCTILYLGRIQHISSPYMRRLSTFCCFRYPLLLDGLGHNRVGRLSAYITSQYYILFLSLYACADNTEQCSLFLLPSLLLFPF